MIQQRVKCGFYWCSSAWAPSQWEAFPMSWFKKTAEVRGTLLEKRLMVAGPFKSSTENSRVPRRDGHYVGPATRPNAEPIRRNNQGRTTLKQDQPHRLDQYPRRCHVRTWKPTSWRCSCHWVAGGFAVAQDNTRIMKNLRLTRHLPIGAR